jgi:hypothetical protein
MTIDEKLDLLIEKVGALEAAIAAQPTPPRPLLRLTLKKLAEVECRSEKFFRKQVRLRRLKPLPGSRPLMFDLAEVVRWRNGGKHWCSHLTKKPPGKGRHGGCIL